MAEKKCFNQPEAHMSVGVKCGHKCKTFGAKISFKRHKGL